MQKQIEQAKEADDKAIKARQAKAKLMLVEVATANELAHTLKQKKK